MIYAWMMSNDNNFFKVTVQVPFNHRQCSVCRKWPSFDINGKLSITSIQPKASLIIPCQFPLSSLQTATSALHQQVAPSPYRAPAKFSSKISSTSKRPLKLIQTISIMGTDRLSVSGWADHQLMSSPHAETEWKLRNTRVMLLSVIFFPVDNTLLMRWSCAKMMLLSQSEPWIKSYARKDDRFTETLKQHLWSDGLPGTENSKHL